MIELDVRDLLAGGFTVEKHEESTRDIYLVFRSDGAANSDKTYAPALHDIALTHTNHVLVPFNVLALCEVNEEASDLFRDDKDKYRQCVLHSVANYGRALRDARRQGGAGAQRVPQLVLDEYRGVTRASLLGRSAGASEAGSDGEDSAGGASAGGAGPADDAEGEDAEEEEEEEEEDDETNGAFGFYSQLQLDLDDLRAARVVHGVVSRCPFCRQFFGLRS